MAEDTNALNSMIEKSLDLLNSIGRKHNPFRIRILEMFSSMFDMAKDSILLLERRRFLLLPLSLRSALDTLADLKLLLIDPENIYYLEAQRMKQEKETVQYEIDLNPSVIENPQTDADIELSNRYERLSTQLEELKRKNYAPLTEKAKFEMTEMIDLYRTYFHAFSMESHNNPAALDSRHLVRDEHGKLIVIFDR